MDPLETDLFNSQRRNSYSYALNNPLRYTDPTGFDGKDEAAAPDLPLISYGPVFDDNHQVDPTHVKEWHCTADGYSECHGITVPTPPGGGDLGTAQAGSPSEEASAPAAPGVLEQIEASPGVRATAQGWGGLFVGLGFGLTPGGAVADQVLTAARVMPRGTPHAEVGKALGEMLGGFFLTASGLAGEIVGTGLTTTGIGSVLGVPAIAVSTGLVTSGAANMAFGLRGFADALMSSGSGDREQAAKGWSGRGGNDDEGSWGHSGKEGRGRGANRADGRMVDDAAMHAGVSDRAGFGKFIEAEKRAAGRRGADNFTWDELLDLADQFKSQGAR